MLRNFAEIREQAKKRGHGRIVVAGAEGTAIMEAVKQACADGVMQPILVGRKEIIEKLAQDINLSLAGIPLYTGDKESEIADISVKLLHENKADGLMKGKVSTPVLLKAILSKKYNLRGSGLLSHIALLEIPSYHKLLLITDGGMVIRPNLEQKIEILKNGLQVMRSLGVVQPKVAVLAAIEKVNPEMEETVHAAHLAELSQKGEFGDCVVEGPLAVDVALSQEAAKIKGVSSRVSGDPDIMIVPDIASGNIFAKGLWHLAGAKIGGLIVGARKPVILLSRSDNTETKLNSIALGAVAN